MRSKVEDRHSCIACLTISGPREFVEAVYSSLHPDNLEAGEEIRISETISSNLYKVEVSVKGGLSSAFKTARSTISEILNLLAMLESVIEGTA
ncbi:MAG: KEOPS complex subunit Pcc1 [Desulfurococcus sp.]|nr:KEOPS complex subunit Pcc1 [Desulfurococcus sp.]